MISRIWKYLASFPAVNINAMEFSSVYTSWKEILSTFFITISRGASPARGLSFPYSPKRNETVENTGRVSLRNPSRCDETPSQFHYTAIRCKLFRTLLSLNIWTSYIETLWIGSNFDSLLLKDNKYQTHSPDVSTFVSLTVWGRVISFFNSTLLFFSLHQYSVE